MFRWLRLSVVWIVVTTLCWSALLSLALKSPHRTHTASGAASQLAFRDPVINHSVSTTTTSPNATFNATFDGAPPVVTPWRPSDWDVQVHSRDTWQSLESMHAQHGADCAAPPASHPISQYEQAVFHCNGHVMTALNASGYGVIYLTPNYLADFSQGETVIRFDVSTLRTSQRDWIDLWVTPYADNLALPFEDQTVDLQGAPHNAVHIRMDQFNGDTVFKASVIRNFATESVDGNWWTGYETFLTPDAKRRDTFELRLSRTHIKFGMPAYDFWWIDSRVADLGWSEGVVQLGHHSYNPTKDCYGDCSPNTWHWDNVRISAGVPFTVVRGDRRFVDATTVNTVRFAQAAPENAHLRFAGYGTRMEVSFDGGRSWQAAQKQAQQYDDPYHFHSYWTPVPEGAIQVEVRARRTSTAEWHARDFSIFAYNTQQAPDQHQLWLPTIRRSKVTKMTSSDPASSMSASTPARNTE
jgi:hypothetical protein